MPATDTLQQHAAHLAQFVNETCSRTLNHFAQEARLDGETLQQAVERYEIDYAWHVLGAPVTQERSVSLLEARLDQPATATQKAYVGKVLQSAAAGMAPEALMSFDNDVPELLADILYVWLKTQPEVPAEAVS